jgi:DNA-binding MarR family transcriptional regulator
MGGGGTQQVGQEARVMLGLLEQVERDGGQTQRHMASELGVALGLVNTYLKRCVKKGLMKVSEAPARRYAYYLTPQGFAEKARLSVDYFSHSFSLFRQARAQYAELFNLAAGHGFSRILLAGFSDLAEIATICALESSVTVVAIVDGTCTKSQFVGVPVLASFDELTMPFDAVVITAFPNAGDVWREARGRVGADRVFVPPMLGLTEFVARGEAT